MSSFKVPEFIYRLNSSFNEEAKQETHTLVNEGGDVVLSLRLSGKTIPESKRNGLLLAMEGLFESAKEAFTEAAGDQGLLVEYKDQFSGIRAVLSSGEKKMEPEYGDQVLDALTDVAEFAATLTQPLPKP